jgi:hypothetical protein
MKNLPTSIEEAPLAVEEALPAVDYCEWRRGGQLGFQKWR